MDNSQQLDLHTVVGEYEKNLLLNETDLWNATIAFINGVTKVLGKGGMVERNIPSHVTSFWYTRMASALSHYFSIHSNEMDMNKIKILSRYKRIIVAIWAASGYRSGEHLKWLMSKGGSKKLTSTEVFLLISIISLDELDDQLIDFTLKQNDLFFYQFILSALSEKFIIMPQGQKNRIKIMAEYEKLLSIDISDSDWMQIFSIWMFSSYAIGDPQAKFKKSINKIITNKLKNQLIYDELELSAVSLREKPRLVVLIEHFQEYHAMYRCYAPQIRALKRDFEVIAVAASGEVDNASNELFHKIITFDQVNSDFRKTIELIKSLQADLIYYPSVGMKGWTIVASNLRLAPIQIASPGHPDTVGSESIDYFIISEQFKDISHRYSEKLIVLNKNYRLHPHSEIPVTRPDKKRKDDYFHIAINCKSMKLSNEFITLCENLKNKSLKKIKYHFFPGETGITLDGIAMQIQKRISDAEIYGYMSYQSLLQHLRNCDLSLAPFPFGNTNSTVDACLMGIPVVAYLGNNFASQTDYSVIKAAGLPLWQVCETIELYERTALQLINDNLLRNEVNNISFEEMKSRLFGDKDQFVDYSLVDAFSFINSNHFNLFKSPARVINL